MGNKGGLHGAPRAVNQGVVNQRVADRGAESPIRGAESPIRGAELPIRGAESPIRGAESPIRGAESPIREESNYVWPMKWVQSFLQIDAVFLLLFMVIYYNFTITVNKIK